MGGPPDYLYTGYCANNTLPIGQIPQVSDYSASSFASSINQIGLKFLPEKNKNLSSTTCLVDKICDKTNENWKGFWPFLLNFFYLHCTRPPT
jgi:hypothetical protein